MPVEYKVCSKEDITQLIAVAIQSYNEHYIYLWHDEGKNYIKNSFNTEQLSKEIQDPNAIFFLVLVNNAPAGFVKLNIDKAIDSYTSDEALELERIYFLKNAAGKGLGKETLLMITTFAKDRGKKLIWLKAMKGGEAQGFYQKQGFEIISETILTLPYIKEEYRGMVVMLKEI
ncbi:GNAT family N-acetyltransferase [Emticicia sp. C21]|uniref:GNAT family N-acetyltransferase n=1 Tax=Emticicia sp. C21 TaxID=2302915 RepID=UPI000E344AA2|nr:GNAT family N-acetyltransferase [Emticicia sp. C21]RFS15197.1 GNAT family N-acetyltransferase [Emticicia sp. C21]